MNRLTAIAFVSVVALSSALANATTLKATIPFAFVVGKQVLPAGIYQVSSLGSNFVQIGTHDKPVMETIAAHFDNNGPGNNATLVFTKYGDQYFLHEVLCDSPVINSALPASKLEKDAQNRQAKLLGSPRTVTAAR